MRRLQRRDDALALGEQVEGGDRLVVADVGVGRTPRLPPQNVLRADCRVVEPRRHRMGAKDLAVLILQHHGAGAMEDARRTRLGESGGMISGRDPAPSGLHPDQGHRLVGYERGEDPGRV